MFTMSQPRCGPMPSTFYSVAHPGAYLQLAVDVTRILFVKSSPYSGLDQARLEVNCDMTVTNSTLTWLNGNVSQRAVPGKNRRFFVFRNVLILTLHCCSQYLTAAPVAGGYPSVVSRSPRAKRGWLPSLTYD